MERNIGIQKKENIYIDHWQSNSSIDEFRYNIKNCFKTEEEAKRCLENFKTELELRQLAEELNNGEKIDWNNTDQIKTVLYYDYKDEKICSDFLTYNKYVKQIYCLDKNFQEKAIEKIGEEKLMNYLQEE